MTSKKELSQMCVQIVVNYLIRRRETVIQALIELRPELVYHHGLSKHYPIENLEAKVEDFINSRDNNSLVKPCGLWRNDWQYRLHGIGCELVHHHTQEKFDWDIGRPDNFIVGELELHLEWRCKTQQEAQEIARYINWTHTQGGDFDRLWNHMIVHRLILEVEPYLWTISSSVRQKLGQSQ
ncbi:MAG: hypothetical protein AAF787_12560 [Chloroflexota bacterium]